MELPNGKNILIQRGMKVYVPVECIQLDPEYYTQPEEFIPERFDERDVKWYRDNCYLLPFGEGPRTCVGQKYGMAQVKNCIANVLMKYEIDVDPKTPKKLTYNPDTINLMYRERVLLNFKTL